MKNKMVMKLSAVLLAFLTVLFAFCGCKSFEDKYAPVGMKALSSDIVDYKLYIPESWTEDLTTGAVSAYVSSSDRSSINVTSFNLEDKKTTATDFWKGYEDTLKDTVKDFEYVSEAETLLWGEKAAYKYVYTGKIAGDSFKFMQVVMTTGGTVYIFTYTSTEELFDSHLDDVNKILENTAFER